MLGIDRSAARYAWTVVLVTILLYVVYLIRTTVFVFILALLFAYLLSPLVNLLDRILPGRTRTPALALAYIIFVGLVVLIGIRIGSRVVDEANSFAKRLPQMLTDWEQPNPSAPAMLNSFKRDLIEKIQGSTTDLLAALSRAGLKALTLASDLIYLVIIPILAFFFLKDGRAIRQHVLDMVEDGPNRELLNDVLADVDLLLAHYMRALVLLSGAAFTAYCIFLLIVGTPFALLLAVLAGLFEFIPLLGPLTAGVTILIVTAVFAKPVVVTFFFLLAYRVFQDYILSPHLMGQGVELHPLLVLFGVFAGAEIAGIPGTFLSVPILALVRILYLRIRKARLSTRLTPPSPVHL
jgi:predicted PurR-regulated permease PerM